MNMTILSMSVSGSVLVLVLFALKPLLKNRAPAAFSYYIWLLVLLRLTIPFGFTLDVAGLTPTRALVSPPVQTVGEANLDVSAPPAPTGDAELLPAVPEAMPEAVPVRSAAKSAPLAWIAEYLDLIWALGAIASFFWYVAAYLIFLRRVGKSYTPPDPLDAAVFEKLRGGRRVRLLCGDVATPIQMGIFRPVIILPPTAYAANGMEQELRDVLLHELTHYRRRDVLYKWFAVLARSLHWFNPLVYLVKRELDRACELACDEAVIRTMTGEERTRYGNTLLSMAAKRRLPTGVTATTMSEEKKYLKGRLMNIMLYRKKTKGAIALLLALAVLLAGCASFRAGVSSAPKATPEELVERATELLATADTTSNYVGEYDMDGRHVIVSVPVNPSPLFEGRHEAIQEGLNNADLSEFELYDGEVGFAANAFLIHDGDSFCKVETGLSLTAEELFSQSADAADLQMILTFTFEDTGDSVTIIGPMEGNIDTVASMSSDADESMLSSWRMYAETEGYGSDNWLEASGYAFKVAVITYFEGGTAVEGPVACRSLKWSAYIASVIESAMEYLEPINTPEQFQADRAVTIQEAGYGACAFDLGNHLLSVETENGVSYYDLSCMDEYGLAFLHVTLGDLDYYVNYAENSGE